MFKHIRGDVSGGHTDITSWRDKIIKTNNEITVIYYTY